MSLILGKNLAETLHKRVSAGPGRTALLRKVQGVWTSVSWKEVESQVFAMATALKAAGVGEGDRVAIISQTRPEWAFADWAVMSLGAISVPVYPSVTADDVHFILLDCRAKFAFIENSVQWEKIAALRSRLPELEGVVSFDDAPPGVDAQSLRNWIHASRIGLDVDSALALWRESSAAFDGALPATIVYTSGTEGYPKGVVLSHSNFIEVMREIASVIKAGEQDTSLLILPVAHIIGRIEQMLALGLGITTAYAQGLSSFMDDLVEVRPTILFGVPRIFEKIRNGILSGAGTRNKPLQELLSLWSMEAGQRYSQALRNGEKPGFLLRAQHEILDRLVFGKVRSKFGGRLRFSVCGGAPLSHDVAEFFHACGILLLEGYGLTETTGPICLNTPQAFRFGTVGKPLPGASVRFGEDGEILLKGPGLCLGYYGKSQDTEKAFTDGWFHSGDIGLLDAQGYLRITDRKKDIIITSGGKNIAPQRIEDRFKVFPLISHVLVAGDQRNHLTALITVNIEQARLVCEKQGISFRGLEDLVRDEGFLKHVQGIVTKVNSSLATYEQIKKHRVLPRDFSIEAGELTPSMKVKRVFCIRKYADWIEEMYR